MILTDADIRGAYESGSIQIDPFEEASVQPASYDLRVGPEAIASSSREIMNVEEAGFVEILPGDFVIVTVLERLHVDNLHVGRFGLQSSHARRGLIATTGPQIDPGYRGRLTIGLTNLSTRPYTLTYRQTFLTAEFHRLEKPVATTYTGPYLDRDQLGPEDIAAVMDREYMSQTEMMQTLQALVTTVGGLEKAVNASIENVEKVVNAGLDGFKQGIGIRVAVYLALGGAAVAIALALTA